MWCPPSQFLDVVITIDSAIVGIAIVTCKPRPMGGQKSCEPVRAGAG